MRKLVSIQQTTEVYSHPNANLLAIAKINGWNCVVNKSDSFKSGDLGVYCELDDSIESNVREFRGVLTQCIFLPLSQFPEILNPTLGQDVSELLGIRNIKDLNRFKIANLINYRLSLIMDRNRLEMEYI